MFRRNLKLDTGAFGRLLGCSLPCEGIKARFFTTIRGRFLQERFVGSGRGLGTGLSYFCRRGWALLRRGVLVVFIILSSNL